LGRPLQPMRKESGDLPNHACHNDDGNIVWQRAKMQHLCDELSLKHCRAAYAKFANHRQLWL